MNKNVLFAALIILALFSVIAFTSIYSFQYSLPFFGKTVVQTAATTCNETDDGVLFYIKGKISLCTGASCIGKGEDYCTGSIITEYFCTEKSEIKTVNLKCPYGCDDGACLTIGQKPKPKIEQPAETPKENKSAEEQVKEIVCDEGWTCADKIKAYQNVDCSFVKEEYCKYGCIEGGCKNPVFWEKFLYWLKEQAK